MLSLLIKGRLAEGPQQCLARTRITHLCLWLDWVACPTPSEPAPGYPSWTFALFLLSRCSRPPRAQPDSMHPVDFVLFSFSTNTHASPRAHALPNAQLKQKHGDRVAVTAPTGIAAIPLGVSCRPRTCVLSQHHLLHPLMGNVPPFGCPKLQRFLHVCIRKALISADSKITDSDTAVPDGSPFLYPTFLFSRSLLGHNHPLIRWHRHREGPSTSGTYAACLPLAHAGFFLPFHPLSSGTPTLPFFVPLSNQSFAFLLV